MRKHKSKVSVIIPVYNNATSLAELSKRLAETLNNIFLNYEVLFINDGSKDDSLLVLKKIALLNNRFKVLNLSRNFGQHPAICAGFENASGDYIVLMDADLQDRPEDIAKLYEKIIQENCDVAYSTKTNYKKILSSKITSAIYHYIFSKIIKSHVPHNIGTFRIFNKKFLEEIKRYKEFNVLYGPLMFFMGFKSTFITLKHHDRIHGKSSYNFTKRLTLAINSLISYTDIPHRLSLYLGTLILFLSLSYGAIVLSQYLFFGSNLPGGTTLIVFILSIMLGIFMLFIGIVGGYLFRVYQEVLVRPRYHIQEKINI